MIKLDKTKSTNTTALFFSFWKAVPLFVCVSVLLVKIHHVHICVDIFTFPHFYMYIPVGFHKAGLIMVLDF